MSQQKVSRKNELVKEYNLKKKSPKYERAGMPGSKRKKAVTQVRKPNPIIKKKFEEDTGSRGMNVTVAKQIPSTQSLKLPGQIQAIPVRVRFNNDALDQVIIAFIQYMTLHGYGTSQDQSSYPYHLACQLKKIIFQVISQTTPQTIRGPRFLHVLCQMLSPVIVYHRTGQLSYEWNLDDTSDIINFLVIPGLSGYHMGIASATVPGSYAFSTIQNPLPYTPESGEAAYQAMLTFLSGTDQTQMTIVEDITADLKPFRNDTSTFSVALNGLMPSTVIGGQDLIISNPRKVTCPIAAVFSLWDTYYTSVEAAVYSTTPRFFATRLMTMTDPFRLRSKYRSIFKPIDANDLYDLTCMIVGRAFEKLYTTGNQIANYVPCSLSGAEFFILLRTALSTINGAMYATDYLGQNSTFRPFQYPSAQGNIAATVSTMLLPSYVVENIKNLGMKSIDIQQTKNGDAKFRNQTMIWVPVYGTYQNERQNYDFDLTLNTLTLPMFSNPMNGATFAQDTLNILSGPGTNTFILPTGERLAAAVENWNHYISKVTSCVQVASLVADGVQIGMPLLTYSRYVSNYVFGEQTNSATPSEVYINEKGQQVYRLKVVRTKSKKVEEIDEVVSYKSRLGVDPSVTPVNFRDYTEEAITSNQPILSAFFELASGMVLPKFYGDQQYTMVQRAYARNFTFEPYMVVNSQDNDRTTGPSITLLQRWKSIADKVTVNGIGLESNWWTKTLDIMNDKGSGGFLGSLIGDTLSMITGVPLFAGLGAALPF